MASEAQPRRQRRAEPPETTRKQKGGSRTGPPEAFWEETYAYAAALTFVGTEAIVFRICEAIW